MEYVDFYEIAEYGNINWKGGFSPKEVAKNAYIYMCEFEASKLQGKLTNIMQELCKLLIDDNDTESLDWLCQIASEVYFAERRNGND